MGYLIEVDEQALRAGVSFETALKDLRRAFAHIAAAFWRAAANAKVACQSDISTAALRGALPRVPINAQPVGCSLVRVDAGNWELSEVHRQLCQVAVLIEALRLVEQRHPNGTVTSLSPTQQAGADATGTDENGGVWALEVFGGIDVRNNKKAKKDSSSLLKMNVAHRYFACFEDAWEGYTSKTATFSVVSKSCATPVIALRTVA